MGAPVRRDVARTALRGARTDRWVGGTDPRAARQAGPGPHLHVRERQAGQHRRDRRWRQPRRHEHHGALTAVVLRVLDLTAEIEALETAGVRLRNRMEAGPGGRQIQIEDPDGNTIELFEPA
ncbi:MAG TPA: VOC family protein [Vicinamibacterales bacterium]